MLLVAGYSRTLGLSPVVNLATSAMAYLLLEIFADLCRSHPHVSFSILRLLKCESAFPGA